MVQPPKKNKKKAEKAPLFSLLKPYKLWVIVLVFFTLAGNGANLVIPKIIANGIDSFTSNSYSYHNIIVIFALAAAVIFIFTYAQNIVQTITSEKVARDVRKDLSNKISKLSYPSIQRIGSAKLLTNLTSDIDAIKNFVSHAVSTIVSSIFMIVGISVLLFTINSKLATIVVSIIPVVAVSFYLVLKKVRVYYTKSREVVDWLNRVINESVIGSAIIRVLNTQSTEYQKFLDPSLEARNIGISIVRLFAILIPVITFVGNMALLAILALGGKFVIGGSMSLGDLAAFNSYVAMLIFPIIMIGFMSNVIAQATASYNRVYAVMNEEQPIIQGKLDVVNGNIECRNISYSFDDKKVLKNISFSIEEKGQTAIIGPTAAGKSLLISLLNGLMEPQEGEILYNHHTIDQYMPEAFMDQIATVFQESIVFNISIKENIVFGRDVSKEQLIKAVETAGLTSFIEELPNGWDTIVSERGSSLSGGQKQRLMLARALAKNPKVLLLDDFTARVDRQTENKIQCNLSNNYPDLTLVVISQKIAPVKHFDNIILLMEGELIAQGHHNDLLDTCPEYVQIFQSQLSTNHYEL